MAYFLISHDLIGNDIRGLRDFYVKLIKGGLYIRSMGKDKEENGHSLPLTSETTIRVIVCPTRRNYRA